MPEAIHLLINQPQLYDDLVTSGNPQAGDLRIVTKARATGEGRSAVVVSFNARVGDKTVPVQATTTLRLLATALRPLLEIHEREEEAH